MAGAPTDASKARVLALRKELFATRKELAKARGELDKTRDWVESIAVSLGMLASLPADDDTQKIVFKAAINLFVIARLRGE